MNKTTYIIDKAIIEEVFDISDYVRIVEDAFKIYGNGGVEMPPKVYLTFDEGDLRCMPVYIPSMNTAGVKNVNVHPLNKDLPAVMATISLIDPETGFPLAIMDGTHITGMRTGAAGGVAAKYLSREDSTTAAFIGTGVQAWTQLQALLVTRPNIKKVTLYDIRAESMQAFAEQITTQLSLEAVCAESIAKALESADIVTTTTTVRSPIVKDRYLQPGTHINAIGADAQGKQELCSAILKRSKIVIDNWEQASHSGEINVPFSQGMIKKDDICADIGEIVTGKKTARQSPDDLTVFDSTGLAIQDISVATMIYRKLIADKKIEPKLQRFDFF